MIIRISEIRRLIQQQLNEIKSLWAIDQAAAEALIKMVMNMTPVKPGPSRQDAIGILSPDEKGLCDTIIALYPDGTIKAYHALFDFFGGLIDAESFIMGGYPAAKWDKKRKKWLPDDSPDQVWNDIENGKATEITFAMLN